MNLFKNLFNKVKNVVNKIFNPKKPEPKMTMSEIIKWADNPPVDEPVTLTDEEKFQVAMRRAIEAGEDFHGAEDALLKGDPFRYEQVHSYIERHGYYDVDDNLEDMK